MRKSLTNRAPDVFAKGLASWLDKFYEWSSLGECLKHVLGACLLRRQRKWRRNRADVGLLAWGKRLLPNHFCRSASRMHEWLGEQLNDLHLHRGSKLNVLGPRGGAKSTIASLCYVLRAALEGWEQYIWIIPILRRKRSNIWRM